MTRDQLTDAAMFGMGITVGDQHVPLEEIYVTKQLPLYVCHKKVRALEIRSIGHYSTDQNEKLRRQVTFADPAFLPIDVPGEMFARYTPMPGDYYVVYEDGYASFSPRKAFLEGYSPESEMDVVQSIDNLLRLSFESDAVLKNLLPNVLRRAKAEIEALRANPLHVVNPGSLKNEKADPDQA